ncbi:HD domain-containing protein [Mucilaginibacter sp.]
MFKKYAYLSGLLKPTMEIIPQVFLDKINSDKHLTKAVLDIDSKIEEIIKTQSPVFFPQYTDHGISHFIDTLKMALHLIDLEEIEKSKGQTPVINYLPGLDIAVLTCAILFHDIGMHIHFKGFKQLINGFFDDVRVAFFDEFTWKQEWENFMIEAKRFSGRERINIFGDEQVIISDIDFTKNTVDSDIQKNLIGEFIRRHHGRLAHEIALKGFPVQDDQIIVFAADLKIEYKDIIGLISRSHSMQVRDAMEYIPNKFPADPHFPYSIEVPFLMCVLRISDYFQFDSSRTNAFIIKLKSFTSPFSLVEHQTHLATEYFKTDDKDPETLFVHLKPKDGLMYNKLIILFDDIQQELDTSFALTGEMYGRNKEHFKLRYRRIKTSLKHKIEINRFPFVVGKHRFEADTDLFKLLVGPLYGYDPSYGVREMLQNAIDACVELNHKKTDYEPFVEIKIQQIGDDYKFIICDNGKGMNVGEIKNYFLKAGSSFRNSMEWKIDYETESNTPAIRRTGKFGIGVLASFLIGDSIEVVTRWYNEPFGYKFKADLTNEYIEIEKAVVSEIGTKIDITINKETFDKLTIETDNLTKWYVLDFPKVTYHVNSDEVNNKTKISLKYEKQFLEDTVRVDFKNFDDVIWKYTDVKETGFIAINGITVPGEYFYPTPRKFSNNYERGTTVYDEIDNFPFVSILDRNNLIDLELSRNAIRGHFPFIKELVESCKLDFLYKLIFFNPPIEADIMDFTKYTRTYDNEFKLSLKTKQFNSDSILVSNNGYFLDNSFYNSLNKNLNHYKFFVTSKPSKRIKIPNNSTASLAELYGTNSERNILRGSYGSYIAISKPEIYLNHFEASAIAKATRDSITLIEKNEEFVIFEKGNNKSNKENNIEELKKLFKSSKATAVQVSNKSLHQENLISKLLKENLNEPKLIPFDYQEKLKFVKTVSAQLQKHIVEKRGININ